ncbi:amidase [Hyaloraphidium curvatum]|nr:amidase [Hyaloraphidium curvatum]
MPADPLLSLSAAEAVAAVRDGRVSARELVRAALDRARACADLNAFIALDERGALAAADRVDAARAAGSPLGPLAGLPVVVKDNINVAGLPTTAATPALRGCAPANTAPSARRLIDAGAVVLGKTNLHELALGGTCTNAAFGAVRNPYDRARIPGGSSGGTAAAIAARIAACGLGTDTGGSTRIPAALCGIAGLRPSVGDGGGQQRYRDGGAVVPISRTRDTVGPMGRTVADVALLDAVVTGSALAEEVPLAGVRLGVPKECWEGLEARVARAAEAARAKLEAAGATLVALSMPELFAMDERVSFVVALHEFPEDMAAYLAASGLAGAVTYDAVAAAAANPDVRGMIGLVAALAGPFAEQYPEAMRVHRPALQELYRRTFASQDLDALLFPTTVLAAIEIDEVRGSGTTSIDGGPELETFRVLIRNTGPASCAGLPGLSVPAGLVEGGLPWGLEIDGPLGSDRRLLGIGMAMERALGAVPPPPEP